jgi:DNA-binding MarR family transcriptional regulator
VPTAESTGLARSAETTARSSASSLCDVSDADVARAWDLVVEAVFATQRRLLAKIESDGLPGPWFHVLRLLRNADENRLPMSALARQLQMTNGGFTKLADRMAREGLIDRRSSSADRRVVYAALTARGAQLAEDSSALYRAALDEHVRGVLSAEGLAQLADAAVTLRDAHAAELPNGGEHVLTERDPALPERRGRRRAPRGS